MPGDQYFRAGAGIVVVNAEGLVLALERAGIEGAWQLPQGGLDPGEEPLQAALREVAEETGLKPDELTLLATYPEPLAYELPREMRNEKTGRGQVGYWFLFRFAGNDARIDLRGGGEFRRFQWMPLKELAERAVAFRRPIYRKLVEGFGRYLKPGPAA